MLRLRGPWRRQDESELAERKVREQLEKRRTPYMLSVMGCASPVGMGSIVCLFWVDSRVCAWVLSWVCGELSASVVNSVHLSVKVHQRGPRVV